jgi:hypothetical protein
MRIFTLLMVLLCGLGLVCRASAGEQQRTSSAAAATGFYNPDTLDTSAVAHHDFFNLPASDRTDRDDQRLDSDRDGDVTCYTMHVLGVKRDSPHSDVTEPSGEWTCRRASKYGVKMVQEPGAAPSH